MNVAIDLTGDMIAYSYHDGNEIVTDVLRNTIGFRTKDLFQYDRELEALMRVAKDMIECTIGMSITETIGVLPSYCTYPERVEIKKAAEACGMHMKKVVRGALATAVQLFQQETEQKTMVLCCVHSDHAELLICTLGGDALEVLGSTSLRFDKSAVTQTPEVLQQRVQSELKALYSELSMNYGDKGEDLYIAADENTDAVRDLFTAVLRPCFGTEHLSFVNTPSRGAYYLLMKQEAFRYEQLRDFRVKDCSVEGICVVSGVNDDLKEVFKRNCPLPMMKTAELMASSDNVVCFYAGNYMNRKHDEVIGTCRIPSAYWGQMIYLKMTLNEDGIVEYIILDAKRQIIYPKAVLG